MSFNPPVKRAVFGNKEVVAAVNAARKIAREGDINYVSIVMTRGDEVMMSHAGNTASISELLTGLEVLVGQLKVEQKSFADGKRDTTLGASHHEYNVASDPMNHDFMIWLVEAEMIRIRERGPPPLRVHFLNYDKISEGGQKWVKNVFRPLMVLLGAVEVYTPGGWRKAGFTPTEICAAAKRGEKVPIFKVPEHHKARVEKWWHGKPPPVTITLREALHHSHRNSNIRAWTRFAKDLRVRGEEVIFVRDTCKANEPVEDFITAPQASFDTRWRFALYETAKINFFTSNGPAGLGIFGTRPYLYFVKMEERKDYPAMAPDWWSQFNGVSEGEDWPWALPGQKMVYKEDTYENISKAWEAR